MRIERKTTAASMAPLQSLAQGSMFWQPDHVEASPWLDHLPWVFWLMETMRPRRCVTLGARPGSPHLALCQAAMRIDPDTECLLVSDDSKTRDIAAAAERRYGGCHRLISASPARAAKRMQSGIDILALDLAGDDENMDLVLERWLELMSDQGVVLLSGINGGDASPIHYELFVSLQERYRSLSFHHGDGLGVVVVGATPPELVETLLARWKTPSAARAVRDVFARLGRGVADQAVSDQHKAKLSHVQQQFEDVVQERDATSERAEKLRQTLDLNEQALAKLSEENRLLDEKLADAHGELKANNEELASVRKTLAETQRTLEESNARNAALEGQLAEKDANINDRFKELALITRQLEESHARLEECNSQLEASNAERQEARTQLEESNARNAALEAMVAEKDANISTRFNELAILTDMLEEADKKRDALEQKAARLFERNEEKKRDAKTFRRQLAKAETRDAQRKDEIHELRESVNASEAAYGDATAREHEALMQVSKLQDKLQERDQELADRFEELGDLTAAMEAREAELEALTLKLAEAAQPTSAEPSQPRPVGKSSKRLGKKAEQRKLQTAIAEVEASQWFDAQWYLQQYPDIASDDNFNRRPAFHYVKFGGFEGRNPSPHFDSAAYLQTYPDVVATGINPLVHYLRDGIREERLARPHDAGSDTKFGVGEST